MRIVIDGTVGAGKTSILLGMSQRDIEHKKFQSIADLGYPVFSDLVISVIKKMRGDGISDPSENWQTFFDLAIKQAIGYYVDASTDTINFYDRGIFYLEILSKRYNCKLPDEYYRFCDENRYDNPVFILEPIMGLNMTVPHETDNKQKAYSTNDRVNQHKQIIQLYKKYNYEVVEVPTKYEDPWKSVAYRLSVIQEVLGI